MLCLGGIVCLHDLVETRLRGEPVMFMLLWLVLSGSQADGGAGECGKQALRVGDLGKCCVMGVQGLGAAGPVSAWSLYCRILNKPQIIFSR